MTVGRVFGPSTALYRFFLKHCTPTNTAVGTIWRDLSKPPQMSQGPDPRPLWLLVGTPSVLRPDLPSRRAEHKLPWQMSLYICDTSILFYKLTCLYIFYDLSALVGCWSSVFVRRVIYTFLKCVSFWLHSFCGKWEGWDPVNRFNYTSWVAIVTPTDRPKSVRNRCVIEVFGGDFVLSRCFFDFLWL